MELFGKIFFSFFKSKKDKILFKNIINKKRNYLGKNLFTIKSIKNKILHIMIINKKWNYLGKYFFPLLKLKKTRFCLKISLIKNGIIWESIFLS